MLKRLRIKFILINMLMAVLVLATTFSVVCYLDYANSINNVNSQLDTVLARVASSSIAQIEDVRPITTETPSPLDPETETDADTGTTSPTITGEATDASTTDSSNAVISRTGSGATNRATASGTTAQTNRTAGTSVGAIVYDETALTFSNPNDSIIPAPSIGTTASATSGAVAPTILVAVYELSNRGFYTTIPAFSTASISESVLLRANEIVETSEENFGSLPQFDLCFSRMSAGDGFIVAYADASSTESWRQLAITLTAVGVAALAIFLLINLFFARWALRPVAESIRQQRQFTADASHELKTPLTVILANMSILESQPQSTVEEQLQWVESTQTEATRMQLLVNEMLDLARPTEDREERGIGKHAKGAKAKVHGRAKDAQDSEVQNSQSKVDFSDLVEGEVLQFESVAFERGVEIESEIEPDVRVLGDGERLGRMVATLIDNACKYTEENGLVQVVLKANAKSDRAVLEVKNSGTPIAEEDLPRLFDRFYRADKARTSGKGGYGLGLAIGREIAREHDGDISVESSVETGTVFTVTLPLA